MNDDKIFIYSVFGFVGGICLFFKGFQWLKQKRLIENIPTSRIRSLAMGLVEIYGEVVPIKNKIFKSPFSLKDCVYCKYKIEEYRSSGKTSHWVTVDSGIMDSYFYLEDDSGKVLIDTRGADVDICKDFEIRSGIGKSPPPEVIRFLKNKDLKFEGLLGINKKMRYREYFIEPKDKLYIMGTAGDNPFIEDATVQKGVEDTMIQKGHDNSPYHISDKPEHEILSDLKWKVIGGIFGGSALTVVCLIIILYNFKLL